MTLFTQLTKELFNITTFQCCDRNHD